MQCVCLYIYTISHTILERPISFGLEVLDSSTGEHKTTKQQEHMKALNISTVAIDKM